MCCVKVILETHRQLARHGLAHNDLVRSRPTKNYIHRSNRKRFSNYLLAKSTNAILGTLLTCVPVKSISLTQLVVRFEISKIERRALDQANPPGARPQLPLLEQSNSVGRAPQNARRAQLCSTEFIVIRYFQLKYFKIYIYIYILIYTKQLIFKIVFNIKIVSFFLVKL